MERKEFFPDGTPIADWFYQADMPQLDQLGKQYRLDEYGNLYVEEGGVLLGSDDIADYDLKTTRIEGQTCTYFTALINVENVQGFTMCGPGTIDGNGHRSWRAFWIRRRWNPKCTNKDEQRPRLVYISESSDVTVAGRCRIPISGQPISTAVSG